jgi:hypothetical protein
MTTVILAFLVLGTSTAAGGEPPRTSGAHTYAVTAAVSGTAQEKQLHVNGLQTCGQRARAACEANHGRPQSGDQKAQRRCKVDPAGAKDCEVTCTVECVPPPPVAKPQDLEAAPRGHEDTLD